MTDADSPNATIHYLCQTYVEKKAGRDGQAGLKIDKQLSFSTAHAAQERAEREFRSGNCVGADAFMVTEDTGSGEVGEPTFLARLGSVPDTDDA